MASWGVWGVAESRMLCKGTLSGRSPSNVVIEESLMKGNAEVDRGKGTNRVGEG